MPLPIRTTVADVEAICSYLASKPTGATATEAKAVLDEKVLDGRKLSAYKFWGVIDDASGKMRLTERGRFLAKDKGAHRAEALRSVIASIPAYAAAVDRAVHRNELTVTSTELAAHWHEHFRDAASEADKVLNDQAVCFFQIAEGADLGALIVGRKGQSTRFEFDEENAVDFADRDTTASESESAGSVPDAAAAEREEATIPAARTEITSPQKAGSSKGNRVFITHGRNKKILEQVKEIVAYGKFEPVVAQEHETAAKPVPDKVMDDMRTCQAAVIHVGAEGSATDKDGNEEPRVNGNVLIEIGAAMALYGRQFILLVEEGLKLPSNLQGLYECRYKGNELSGEATIKLLKAFNAFK